jgi:hypothetical protein
MTRADEDRKYFVFGKKKQKTFIRCSQPPDQPGGTGAACKRFLVLFFKKELLPCHSPAWVVSEAGFASLAWPI